MMTDIQRQIGDLLNGKVWTFALITGDSVVADVDLAPRKRKQDNEDLWITVKPDTLTEDPNSPRGRTRWLRTVDVVISRTADQFDNQEVDDLVRFAQEVAAFLCDEGKQSQTKSLVINGTTLRRNGIEHQLYDDEQLKQGTFWSVISVSYMEL